MRLRFVLVRATTALCGLVLVAALASTSAQALPIDPASSGLNPPNTVGCSDAFCAFGILYNLNGAPSVTGDLDITGSTLTFSISLASATLSGSDGAVSSVVFSDVVYSGTFAISLDGSGGATITDQTASITGSITPDVGSAVLLNATNVNTTGGCSGIGTGSPSCSLIFGPASDFNASVNGNTRHFRHSVSVSAVPEPGTAILLGLGLTLLGVKPRR